MFITRLISSFMKFLSNVILIAKVLRKVVPYYLEWNHTLRKIPNCPKLCGNCAFPQNFHTRKSGEITVFFALIAFWNLLCFSQFESQVQQSSGFMTITVMYTYTGSDRWNNCSHFFFFFEYFKCLKSTYLFQRS